MKRDFTTGRFLKNGGEPLSEEHKRKISLANKGHIMSLEQRQQISERQKGRALSEEAKQKLSDFWKGKKKSPEQIENIRKAKLGDKNPNHNRVYTKEERIKRSQSLKGINKGEKNNAWKGGIYPEIWKQRTCLNYKFWREEVFKRDNFTCQKTKVRGGQLHTHHVLPFSKYPELRFDINNGITLSKKSHKEFHKIYGFNNNLQQLQIFLKGE